MKQLRRSPKIFACVLAACAALAACAESGTTSSNGGSGGTAGSAEGGGGSGGTSSVGGGGAGGEGGSGACLPDDDGTITAAEVPLGPGLSGKFKVATNATFDSTGDKQ